MCASGSDGSLRIPLLFCSPLQGVVRLKQWSGGVSSVLRSESSSQFVMGCDMAQADSQEWLFY